MPLHPSSREQLLHRAIRDGNTAEAEAHAVLLEVDDAEQRNVTLHRAAVHYAAIGLRVFPLQPGSKIPHKGSRGCKDGTSDVKQVSAWWTTRPDSNIGIATGTPYDVIDIDGPEGQQSRVAHWDDIFAEIEADHVGKVRTPRGMHIYVAATGDGNSAGLLPGVDYRGVGGYVVAPPSHTEHGAYRWLTPLQLEACNQ